MGKLSAYTRQQISLKDEDWWPGVVGRVADGAALYQIAQEHGFAYGELVRWIRADADRQQEYLDAQAAQAQKLVDESLEIADGMTEEDAFKSKLRIDTRLRVAGKLDQRFGNGPALQFNGSNIQVVLTQYGQERLPDGVAEDVGNEDK